MSADTNPIWWLIFAVIAGAFLLALASNGLIGLLIWIDYRNADDDAQTAADFNEPSREQVEWEMHVAEAVRLTLADDAATQQFDELEFAASVLADIDHLPGGAA